MTLRTHRAGLGLLSALTLFTSTGLAASGAVELRDGRRLQVAAEHYDANLRSITLRLANGDLEQVDGYELFKLVRSGTTPDDARGQLTVANLARDLGLHEHAARHYRRAEAADPTLALEVELERARMRIAQLESELERTRAALAAAERHDAPEVGTPAADSYATVAAGPRDADASGGLLPIEDELAELRGQLDAMDLATIEGLTADPGRRSVRAFERGVEDGARALERLAELGAEHTDVCSTAAIAALRDEVETRRLELNLHLASHWTVRNSLPKALEHVNLALAIDPEHERALAARERIQDASSDSVLWPWLLAPGVR